MLLGYEDGKTYISSYWGKRHTVKMLSREPGREAVESQWEDGTTTRHVTARGKFDHEIFGNCEPCQERNAFWCAKFCNPTREGGVFGG